MSFPVVLLLGGNLGDRYNNLLKATLEISRHTGTIITSSSVYKTAAWGNTDQPEFYNQAITISPVSGPEDTLSAILKIESAMGRVREEKWGSRIIDIDILLWGDLILTGSKLSIPHPQLPHRRFALLPLAEIFPDFIHPVLHKSIIQLLTECPDTLPVEKLTL